MNEVSYKTLGECKAVMETLKAMGVAVPEWVQKQYDGFQGLLEEGVMEELDKYNLSPRFLTQEEMEQLREEVECKMNGNAIKSDSVLSTIDLASRKRDSRFNRFMADSIGIIGGKVIYADDEGGRLAIERDEAAKKNKRKKS